MMLPRYALSKLSRACCPTHEARSAGSASCWQNVTVRQPKPEPGAVKTGTAAECALPNPQQSNEAPSHLALQAAVAPDAPASPFTNGSG